MTTAYGLDLFCTDDLDPTMPDVTGRSVAIQRLVRRVFTPRGSCPDCPNDGIDLRDYLNRPTATEKEVDGAIRGEYNKDEACLSSQAVVTFSGPLPSRTMKVEISGQLSDGPFNLVLNVSQVTVELLSAT